MISTAHLIGTIELPHVDGEFPMIPFDIATLDGLTSECTELVVEMLGPLTGLTGTAYLTLHGKQLRAGDTLRRGDPHTDGNYEPVHMTFDNPPPGGGWKVGQDGPPVGSPLHTRQYCSERGGIITASTHAACIGWLGEYTGTPGVGGDCRHIALGDSFELAAGTVYYGNNHFIHESLPVREDCHRVMARITLPESHAYMEG